MLGTKRNQELQKQVFDFLELIRHGISTYDQAVNHLLENGLDEHYDVLMRQVHQSESNADDVRHDISLSLYKKSLLPESRGDLLSLLEQIDRLANRADALTYGIRTLGLAIPEFLRKDMREINRLSVETVGILLDGVVALLGRARELPAFARQIDNNESLCDQLERKMIGDIIRCDLEPVNRILLKELIEDIGDITDICENIAHYVTIFHIKHTI
jgi:predicted phosphate transport protein (TIGR00153 family)